MLAASSTRRTPGASAIRRRAVSGVIGSSNSTVIDEAPCVLVALMVDTDGIVENCLISGVATALAMVSGAAPGSCADTEITGNSTSGKAATGMNL